MSSQVSFDVKVLLENGTNLELKVPESAVRLGPVAFVKREVEKVTQLPPLLQRIEVVGAKEVDSFAFPMVLKVTKRSNRSPSAFAKIKQLNSGFYYTIRVDPSDSILDLKFLLSSETHKPAEEHRIYVEGGLLKDSDSISRVLQTSAPDSVRVAFVYIDKDGFEVRRSFPDLVSFPEPVQGTVKSIFKSAVSKFKNGRFLGARTGSNGDYEWQTYGEIGARVENLIGGLVSFGVKKGDKIGLWSINRPEWLIVDLACCTHGLVSVPLYDTLGPSACEYILNHAEVRYLFVESSKLEQAQALKLKCKSLQAIIVLDKDFPDGMSLSKVERVGRELIASGKKVDSPVSPQDVATICYTSGTTGNPKGVIITQLSFASAIVALSVKASEKIRTPGCALLSYLPLAHIYERVMELSSVNLGHCIGYFSGDITKLLDDVSALKPDLFPGVPRVWQRIYDRVNGQIEESNFIRKLLFNHSFSVKQGNISAGDLSETFWDRLVFNKVKAKFGGNLKAISTGAAPLSPRISEFLRIVLNTDFMEGYGLTETCAVSCISDISDPLFGHCGTPTCCVEIKLADVPEMDYLTSDKPSPRGEIWIRGPAVFSGYFKNPEATSDSMTPDGWFKTGDIGLWRPDGNLQIIDRKKNIFKLSQGEYIRPEYIENVYKQSKMITGVFVYGDSFQQYLVAIIVPNWENVLPWAKANGLSDSRDQLLQNPKLMNAIMDDMAIVGKKEGLKGFEEVKKIRLVAEEFTVENGLLTPSFKVKRHQAKLKFKHLIDSMYSSDPKAKL